MKKPFLSVTKLFLTTIAGISFASLLTAQPTLAQLSTVDSNTSIDPQGSSNPLGNVNSGDFNMLDLVHRANFGNINWNAAEQNQKLDSAATEFKAKQQQRIQGQQQPTPGSTLNAPEGTKTQSISIPVNK
ncbi:hypothetical protein NIES4074_31670 [Cylindrospermum sp. NIES-4074]|nr:hypothetical protein NIES4074_31670 [Cylindrospermum sp. NIES-4074]